MISSFELLEPRYINFISCKLQGLWLIHVYCMYIHNDLILISFHNIFHVTLQLFSIMMAC